MVVDGSSCLHSQQGVELWQHCIQHKICADSHGFAPDSHRIRAEVAVAILEDWLLDNPWQLKRSNLGSPKDLRVWMSKQVHVHELHNPKSFPRQIVHKLTKGA